MPKEETQFRHVAPSLVFFFLISGQLFKSSKLLPLCLGITGVSVVPVIKIWFLSKKISSGYLRERTWPCCNFLLFPRKINMLPRASVLSQGCVFLRIRSQLDSNFPRYFSCTVDFLQKHLFWVHHAVTNIFLHGLFSRVSGLWMWSKLATVVDHFSHNFNIGS